MKGMQNTGWEQLNCCFFTNSCRRIIGAYLSTQDFVESEVTPSGGIVFRKLEVFLEIGYEPQTCPNFAPTAVLGIGPRKFDSDGLPCGIPLWQLLPGNAPERRYTFWTFATEVELDETLTRIRDTLLEGYAKPHWQNPEQLRKFVASFRAKILTGQ